MNRRPVARRPVTHYGETVYPYEVELPEQDMNLDQPCETCVFIPTPAGKCICRDAS